MSNFETALKKKINELKDIRDCLLEDAAAYDTKIQLLEELLFDETGEESSDSAPSKKRRPGRPKGSKNKRKGAEVPKHAADPAALDRNLELYQAAISQLGDEATTPELQAKLTKRFSPQPRPVRELGAGVKAGTKADVVDRPDRSGDAHLSVEDEETE